MRLTTLAAVLMAATLGAPALAQTTDVPLEAPLPDPNDRGDYLNIVVGAAFVPDYEGSDEHRIVPGVVLRARTGGISIFTRGTYLYADLIRGGEGIDFDAGPIIGVRLNRTGKVKDDRVNDLPDRKVAVEAGGFAGLTFKGLTNPYDSLSIRVDAVKDFANAHESWVISPALDFGTPLSRTTFVGASLSADFVSNRFADYYFGISPSGSLASGLPVYDADGGLKSWQAGLLLGHSLSGNLRKGWGLFGTAGYKRLVGDIADSPIVDDRGSPNQWFGAIGVGYSF